jgi:hypothetical protein
VPEGLGKTVLSGKGGFNAKIEEFILDYESPVPGRQNKSRPAVFLPGLLQRK